MKEGEAVFPKKIQLSKLLHSVGGNVNINTVKSTSLEADYADLCLRIGMCSFIAGMWFKRCYKLS